MSKQVGPCAFSNACSVPGPRISAPADNHEYCPIHARAMALPQVGDLGLQSIENHAHFNYNLNDAHPRRRTWSTYAGIVTG